MRGSLRLSGVITKGETLTIVHTRQEIIPKRNQRTVTPREAINLEQTVLEPIFLVLLEWYPIDFSDIIGRVQPSNSKLGIVRK